MVDGLNDATVALAFLLVVLFVATRWGSRPAVVASVLGMLCFNFFFLPPVYTLTIADPENWVALVAFLVTALVGGQLSARAERHAAEAEAGRTEAMKSAEEIRDLYNHAPCGYHSLDKDGVFVRINDTELEWLGYTRQDVIGRLHFADLLAPESVKTFTREFPRLKAEGVVRDIEFDLVRRDGTILPVLLSASAIIDSGGRYLMSRATVYDISERKRAEAEVRTSEARRAATMQASLDAIVAVDARGGITEFNPAAERMFGHRREDVLGREIEDVIIPPSLRDRHRQGLARYLTTGVATVLGRRVELTAIRASGEEFPVELAIARIALAGPAQFTGYIRDITERKRAEDALRRLNRAHRALSSCNKALIRITEEAAWLDEICRIIVDEAGYRFCWIGRAEHDGAKAVTPVAQAGVDEGYLKTLNITWADTERGREPTGTSVRTGQTQAVKNIAADSRLVSWGQDALKHGYASSLAIPIVVDSEPFGALTIYSAEADAFSDEEVELLSELTGDLGYGIATLRTRGERERAEAEIRALNAELEQRVVARTAQLQNANTLKDELIVREQAAAAELAAAREREGQIGFRIQQMLLLTQPPRDLSGLQVAALTIPSQRIDGDFYDFFKHENQSLDVIVADVMGKGVPAGLLAAATKTNFLEALCHLMALSRAGALPEPKDIVTLAHADMVGHLIDLESFVTLSYARLDLNRQRLDLVDCGHTGMMVVRATTGRCEIVYGDNLPLGIREGEVFSQITVPFEPGDLFLFYSDGITEMRDAAGELFGAARLSDCVRLNRTLEPEALVEAIRRAVFAFAASDTPSDDLTCVAIKVGDREVPLARAELEIDSDVRNLRRVREFVRTFCRDLPGCPLAEEGIAELELAVNEAASNIMKHAYHGRADQRIDLECEAFPSRVAIRLHHLGDAFDPSAVSPPNLDGSRESGFGVYFVTKCVDEVRHYRDERGRNCIALAKVRKS
ncbi:MAG: hypothetical protein A3G76_09655 [Acidobacteria bacterium RIFCSPLOWO2_12_FULL_65_11]|nr:MAG: hypothetical protein A3H95_12550 [Acidobacteria bacterium RIFCSPLOWO2_02_FULL_64_15]OFW28734.1 MAG: hypothetical protein A3G76_09655 [Acidobacteria bacterium RIFCSPLOWO2_12_FULL_65_11]